MAFISAEQAGGEAVVRFLDLTAFSEGTSTHPLTKNEGYDVIVTGIRGPSLLSDYSDHPFAHGGSIQWKLDPPDYSTAAGRYQLLAKYWRIYRIQLHLPDYSPLSQDTVALQQMKERHAIPLILAGKIAGAIEACSNIWASFPGNSYGQHAHPMEVLLSKYENP